MGLLRAFVQKRDEVRQGMQEAAAQQAAEAEQAERDELVKTIVDAEGGVEPWDPEAKNE